MRTLGLLTFALLASTTLAACGPACHTANLCAVDGTAEEDKLVCDGSDFVACDDDHRGVTIFCDDLPRKASCGRSGWSFEYAPLAR